jgi:hypothetical protein
MYAQRRWIVLCLAFLGLSGCEELKSLTEAETTTAASDNRRSFPAVWISASWSSGKTGLPLTARSVFPTAPFVSLCPTSVIIMENHTMKYAAYPFGDILLIGNNCTVPIFVAVCRTAGTGGQPSPSIPTCGVDPRKTSGFNFNIQRLGAASTANPYPFGNTPIALDVEVFYCGAGSDFNFSVSKPKAGADPTDCIEVP